ncbi:MAG: 4Fe-4S dicluster domain-containing protein [Candidatus Cloacimonetes bacterium]|nr:4Fe-4S dicluster domain-containing protein [Candidatus Cloacimonadota bacterium]
MAKKIKLDDKTQAFQKLVEDLCGQNTAKCDQCGTCSGGCPFVEDMDITPAELMRKVMLGQEDVLESETMWICATCNTCTVRCPRKLDVSKIAEALRQIRLRNEIDQLDIGKISREEIKELPQIALIAALRKLSS